ncbi:type II secretion system protein [Undibacterium amnicola]|uniref:Type II secretion system protein n=1 Tax=Undibacterium amnicola TaxID=1834038 RepID=A0ABR6XTS3_9BURK|nr:type II secretion system protein [Undibacterium amnicola]MBC3832902.1 type II secretion system protein [Undibacterium amnicola]
MKKQSGFSFIELIVSVVIIGTLATVAVPFVETTVRREKERELRIALRDIRQAIDAYKFAANSGKIAVREDQSGYPPSLIELVSGVDDISRPNAAKLYFIRKIPRDPFYADANQPAIKTWGLRSFQSSPEQPREGDDVFDVYSLSNKTGLNGIPYAEW